MTKVKTIGKKELKKFINENGFFYSMKLVKKNAPEAVAKLVPEKATYFEGIVSNGELNRNGYIIRPDALMASLNDFMSNPVILLQHETDEPIGHCLSAYASGSGDSQQVNVSGYIYDDLTNGRFGRDLFRGLSTGHIPHDFEFQNSKTGEIVSQEEFRKYNWEEQYSGDWLTCVTALDWVEFSLVAIGSVRKALVTSKNCIEAILTNGKLSTNSISKIMKNSIKKNEAEVVEPVKAPEETEVKEETKEEGETKVDSKEPEEGKDSEKPAENAEAPAEVAEKSEEAEGESTDEKVKEDKVRISKADRVRLQNAADLLVKTLDATMADEEEEPVKPEAKSEEEQKEVAKTDGEKPAEEAKPEEAKEVEGAENNSVKTLEISPEVKNALQALVDVNVALEKENAELKKNLASVPHKRGLHIASQFNKPVEDKQKHQAKVVQSAVTLLAQAGVNVQ